MLSFGTFVCLLLSLSLPQPLHAAALAREDVGEERQAGAADRHTTRPVIYASNPGPARQKLAGGMYNSALSSWRAPSSEEIDRQGVIGEYADMQDSTEMSLVYNSGQSLMTVVPTASPQEVSNSVKDAKRMELLPRLVEPQTGREPVTRGGLGGTSTRQARDRWLRSTPAQEKPPVTPNETADSQIPALLSISVPTNGPTLDSPTVLYRRLHRVTERLIPSLVTERLPVKGPLGTRSPSFPAHGETQQSTEARKDDGNTLRGFITGPVHRGNDSKDTDEDGPSGDKMQDSDVSETNTASLPDCNVDPAAAHCQLSSQSCTTVYPEDFTSDQSRQPSLAPSPPLFVPLYSDWNSALATWGFAWEAHVYGLGSVFAVSGVISVVCLLGLPLCCPPGSPYFTLLHLFLLAFGGVRSFSLLYDAYNHQERLPPLGSLLLSELPFPCLTSAFSLAFLLLSLRSRMHLSLRLALSASLSVSPKPCLLLCMSLLHFGVCLGCVGLLQLLPSLSVLLLFPQGLFVCLSILLPCSYLIFYCFIRADTKHIYRLSDNGEGGGSPDVIRPSRCPFAELEDWGRAAGAGIAASLCLLGCGGLQLYGILHSLGVGGVSGYGFHPWPWWGYQLSCRLCEVGVCMGLSLIGSHPLFCQTNSSIKNHPKPGSWSQLSCNSPSALPAPPSQRSREIKPSHFSCSLDVQEKLVVCEVITKGQSEVLPLCTIVDLPHNGLESKTMSGRTSLLPLPTPPTPPHKLKGVADRHLSSLDSLGFDTDFTVDLRPPSPIDLSRSIDLALFRDPLFSNSLFGPPRLRHSSSNLSLNSPSQSCPKQGYNSAENALYRTSSCGEMDQENPLSKPKSSQACGNASSQSKPSTSLEQWSWKGSNSGSFFQAPLGGSSQGLCYSPGQTGKIRSHPWAHKGQNFAQSSLPHAIPHLPYHRRYRTLSLASQDSRGSGRLAGTEHLSKSKQLEQERAVQAEFVNVCRQIDALSLCSDTIEL